MHTHIKPLVDPQNSTLLTHCLQVPKVLWKTDWTQTWIKSVWHSDGIPERIFTKKLILKKISRRQKKRKIFPEGKELKDYATNEKTCTVFVQDVSPNINLMKIRKWRRLNRISLRLNIPTQRLFVWLRAPPYSF